MRSISRSARRCSAVNSSIRLDAAATIGCFGSSFALRPHRDPYACGAVRTIRGAGDSPGNRPNRPSDRPATSPPAAGRSTVEEITSGNHGLDGSARRNRLCSVASDRDALSGAHYRGSSHHDRRAQLFRALRHGARRQWVSSKFGLVGGGDQSTPDRLGRGGCRGVESRLARPLRHTPMVQRPSDSGRGAA